jgi:hypothetical protein
MTIADLLGHPLPDERDLDRDIRTIEGHLWWPISRSTGPAVACDFRWVIRSVCFFGEVQKNEGQCI